MEDCSKYAHSPIHLAVLRRDHVALKRIVLPLPKLPKAGEVETEAESLSAELKADEVSQVIDRRDVPGRETPLHLAVRLRDVVSAEILMCAGADWSLQNENGWSALQEAVCSREEQIAVVITRHYQSLAWAKWCRRLPRIVASATRIRDFYMEITFHFESSVIPFIGRIAPSDTYRIWKRGANLRADMTLAGFDGFRIQRSDQTFLFLGEGFTSEDGNVSLPCGSLIVLAHKEKEITNALEGAGKHPSEAEVARELAMMSQTNMYRPGIDVTQAELVPHLNWRHQERTEMVGNWKAKIYDMLHVMVSVKSRRVPGAMSDEELFAVDEDERIVNGGGDDDDFDDMLTADERAQLDSALCMGNTDGNCEDEDLGDCPENGSSYETCESNGVVKEKKSWFGWNKKGSKSQIDDLEDLKAKKKLSKLGSDASKQKVLDHQKSSSDLCNEDMGDSKKGKEKCSKKKKKKGSAATETKSESEYKKGLRPVLWLTPDFPLKTEELLPLLDILANKVKAIRRLRELLTTKLPSGTFPVKTIYGDTYRCVDFHKQPAFDHPLLKNHSLIYEMKSKRMRDEVSLKNTEFSKMWKNGKGCPLGTVPINTKSSLTSYHPTTNGEPGYHFAGIRTNNNNLKYMGGGMSTTVLDVKVGALQLSGAHVKIQGGSDYIQLGWSVNPNLNSDSRVRSFIFTHTDSEHCYNLLCPGFILVRHDVAIDHVLDPVSQLGGPIYNRAFLLAKDSYDGDWMIVLRRKNRAKIGIWPQQIFSGLKDFATNIEWGGIAYSPQGIPSPPMGFGALNEEFSPKFNAYFMQVEIINENNEIVDAKDAESFADQTYEVSMKAFTMTLDVSFFMEEVGDNFN